MRNSYLIIALAALICLAFTRAPEKRIKIWMIGDSTMCPYGPERAPITGWGMPFAGFFDSTVQIENRAKGGRSTRTFISENRWTPIADSMQAGDYVFMQFGHNDEAKEEKYKDRYTPVPDYKTNLKRFITETRNRNCIPVLVTPVGRRRFDKAGKAMETHQEYTAAVLEVGAATGTTVIDLDAMSRELYNKFGEADSKLLFMELEPGEHPNYPSGTHDNTHFSEYGARLIAQLVLKDIRLKLPELAAKIRSVKK